MQTIREMMPSATLFFGWTTVTFYLLLALCHGMCREWRTAVIAALFAASNAAIFCWR